MPGPTLTIAEAAEILEPPMAPADLRAHIIALRWQPAEYRRSGRPGHPVPAYPAERILGLHAALVPFMDHGE